MFTTKLSVVELQTEALGAERVSMLRFLEKKKKYCLSQLQMLGQVQGQTDKHITRCKIVCSIVIILKYIDAVRQLGGAGTETGTQTSRQTTRIDQR